MKPRFHFLAVAFLYFIIKINPVFSQEPIFNRVSPPEGRSWGIITGITQDPQGYMWITVHGNGLYKYDGYQFVRYRHDPEDPNSLVSNVAECVYADRQGIIWIGTYVGLDRFDPATECL